MTLNPWPSWTVRFLRLEFWGRYACADFAQAASVHRVLAALHISPTMGDITALREQIRQKTL